MRLGVLGVILFSFVVFLKPTFARANFNNTLTSKAISYASEGSPTGYLENRTVFQTQNFKLESVFFFESGPRGLWSLDAPEIRYQFNYGTLEKNSIWFGRGHPLAINRGESISAFTAFGSDWTQNQVNALHPFVDGWIGFGVQKEIFSGFEIFGAYSPLFIPTFSPGLGINKRGELNPSRFARLPPTTVETGGVLLPIRYQIQIDQLSELLLQHSLFLGTAFTHTSWRAEAFAYTAPRTTPKTNTTAGLAINEDTVNAKVQVKPLFPRETWAGLSMQNTSLPFAPRLEFKQSLTEGEKNYVSLWGKKELQKGQPIEIGLLTRLNQSPVDYPDLSDLLLMAKVPVSFTDSLKYSTIIETTLQTARKSFFWLNQVQYTFFQNFSAIAEVGILGGEDTSFFGEWRAHDFISLGATWAW